MGAVGPAPTFCLVIVGGIEIDGPEGIQDLHLLVPAHVLIQSGGDRRFLGLVPSRAAGFFDEVIVQGEVRCHV